MCNEEENFGKIESVFITDLETGKELINLIVPKETEHTITFTIGPGTNKEFLRLFRKNLPTIKK